MLTSLKEVSLRVYYTSGKRQSTICSVSVTICIGHFDGPPPGIFLIVRLSGYILSRSPRHPTTRFAAGNGRGYRAYLRYSFANV